jgi:hypothetical protein
MNLFETMDLLLRDWIESFAQQRTAVRIRPLTYGLLLSPPKHTTSAAICTIGRQFDDWSADYRVFSRSPWDPQALFDPSSITPSHYFLHRRLLLSEPWMTRAVKNQDAISPA